ncbi:MAG: DEAD/DEAH box helicase family protein [Candidatus ainarchaeum sp.]|nr:DEAD/DEAH box helicase family protein [Candidatus ainarchaeum sp.]
MHIQANNKEIDDVPSNYYTGPKLRNWQKEAINYWEGYQKGIVQAVPGAGKTFLAINSFCRKFDKDDPKLRVLIVCPRLTLIEQWTSAILKNTTFTKDDIFEVSSNNQVKAFLHAQNCLHKHKVFISTFNQIQQFFKENSWKDYNWFLIVDEMHNTNENYKFPDGAIKYKLGLSATPKKKGKSSDFNLGGIIYTYGFSQALDDNIILNPVFKIVLYSVSEQLFEKMQQNSDEDHEKNLDFIESAYDSFLDDNTNVMKNGKYNEEADIFTSKNIDYLGIQKILKNEFDIGTKDPKQTLIFVNRIKKSDLLETMINENFGKDVAFSYHSQTKTYTRKGNFEGIKKSFESKNFNVLVSVGTLGEGIDFPYASSGILASPIYNPTAFVQKVGRLLRSYKDDKKAIIYYYAPSELVARLLVDPKIEPNYFKAVLKIASERGNLYFVNRKTLKEEKGDFSQLLSQGSAYARNEEIEQIKIPQEIDMILRFFRKIYPKSFKHWRKAINEEDTEFNELKKIILEKSKTIELTANHLLKYLTKINLLQDSFKLGQFNKYENIQDFIKTGLKNQIITRIKYGQELEKIYNDKKSVLDDSEKRLFVLAISMEFDNFLKTNDDLTKNIKLIQNALNELSKTNQDSDFDIKPNERNKRITSMFKISQAFFKIQSILLDQVDLTEVLKSNENEKLILTIGQDVFVSKTIAKKFAFPEDFGYSRWQEVREKPKAPELTPKEKFYHSLIKIDIDRILSKLEFEQIKEKISTESKLEKIPTNNEILKELEIYKAHKKFSLSQVFMIIETIKRIEKN